MAKGGLTAVVALAAGVVVAQEFESSYAFDRWYVGGAGTLVLPQGGAQMRRLGGGEARVGYYVTESFAFEGATAWVEDSAGLAAKALWHLQGWEFWGKLFGYERFDPFLTVGVQGWMGHGQVGPACGFGTLYYLTDSWALRAEADLTLGLDSAAEAVHSLSLGLQYSF